MPENIISAQSENIKLPGTKINPGPVSIDLSFSQLQKSGKMYELKLNAVFNINDKHLESSKMAKVRAWVEFHYANIYGSYSEAKYGEDVPLEEVLVNGDLIWEGNPFDIEDDLDLRGEIQLPREGVWEITGYIESEGSGVSTLDKRFEEEIRVAVTRDAAVIMGDTWEFETGSLAYLDNFSYGQLSERVPNELFEPVVLELDISRIPGVGEEALITCVIRSLHDVTDFTAEITFIRRTDDNPWLKVSGDNLLVDGDLKWEGNLKQDEPVEFSATIKLPEGGDWQIYAFGDYPTNEMIGFSDNIKMNISGNIRSFGWEERPLKPLPEDVEIQGIDPFSNERSSISRSDSTQNKEQNSNQDTPESQALPQPERRTPSLSPPPPPTTDEIKQSDEGETDQNSLLPPPRPPRESRSETEINNEATRSAEIIPADISSINEKLQRIVGNGALEITDARNEYGRQYQMADGKKRAIISSTPIQYKAADGTYQLIDNTLVPVSGDDKYAFTNSSHSFSVYFPSYLEEGSDILVKTETGEEIRLGQNTRLGTNNNQGEQNLLQQGNAREGNTNKNTISYTERFTGVTESYTVETWGLKHNYIIEQPIILDSADKYLEFTERVDLPEGSYLSVDGNRQDG
ncbi:MAG: hypothetical protein GX660_29120, partial [Clostridiaceae bacterium]|nr:hypothetical protein [Clostridiaceae bacterium]